MKKTLPFLAYAVLILVVFWGFLLPPEGKILFGPDITRYHYFQRQFLGSALGEGQIPWWNPYTMMGVPYLEHPQIPLWYLPNLLFALLPITVAISWYIALHLFIAMAGMYVLVRQTVNGKRQNEIRYQFSVISFSLSVFRLPFSLPAWAAGVAFGLSAYFVARIPAGHIDIIAASAWMPWVVWGAVSCSPRWSFGEAGQLSAVSWKKSCILTAIFLATQLLAGHPMVAVFTLEALLIITLSICFFVKSFMPLVRMMLAAAIGIGLSAIQIVPNAQFIAHSIRRLSFPDSWAQLGTPTVGHLLEFLDPFYFYSRLPDSGFGFEHVGYMGKIPIIFILVAIIFWIFSKKNRRWEIPAFVLVGLFGIWMWLGNNAPIDLFSWVRSWFPLYSQIRIPARHVLLVVLSLSVLFGIGLAHVKSKIFQLIVTGVLLFELVPFASRHLTLVPVPEWAEDPELISILTQDKSLFRFLPNFYHGDPLREALEFNAPIAHKIQSVSGYDTPPLRNMYEFLLAVNGFTFNEVIAYSESTPPFRNINSPYLNFLNMKYILVPIAGDTIKGIQSGQLAPHQTLGAGFSLIKENTNRGWRLYENKHVLPRFFIATQIQREPNREAVLAAIGQAGLRDSIRPVSRLGGQNGQARQGNVESQITIIVDGSNVDTSGFAPDCPIDTKGSVVVNAYGLGTISLTATTPCNAFLATSEVMYPGWMATVDGKPTSIFEGNAAFRTVYLPRGTHIVVFSYRPTIVLWGALITILTICTLILSFARPGLAKLTVFIFSRLDINLHR